MTSIVSPSCQWPSVSFSKSSSLSNCILPSIPKSEPILSLTLGKSIDIDIISDSKNIYLDNALNSFNINEKIVNVDYHTSSSYLNKKINKNILFIIGMDNITEDIKKKIYASKNFDYFKIIIIPDIKDSNFNTLSNFISDFDQIKSNRIAYKNILHKS